MKDIKDLEKKIDRLDNLFSISAIVNQAIELEDFVEKFCAFVNKKIPYLKLIFAAYDGRVFRFFSTDKLIKSDEYFECDFENSSLWNVLNKKQLIKLKDNDLNLFSAFLDETGFNEGDVEYLKGFFDKDSPACFCFVLNKDNAEISEDDIEELSSFLNYVEPNIIKYIENKGQQQEMMELQKSLYNISILYNISQAVNFIDDLKRLLQVILSKALATIDAEKGSLMLYDYSSNSLQVKVVYGLSDKITEENINNGFLECSKIKAGEGVAGTVFLEKRAIITNLGSNDPRYINKSSLSSTKSLLCVPLIAKGEAIGVINISNKKGNKLFNQKDLDFMTSLANQAAIAIDNAKLYELATKDGLTKLYMYRHFYTLLENEIRRCARYKHNTSLLMIDIDNFKSINDIYGHLAGDQILREISSQVKETVRKIDIPARYGGEEFAVILPETTKEDAVIIANRIRKNIEALNVKVHSAKEIKVTISIGVAQYDFKSLDPKSLIEMADKALYNSKNNGKNVVSVFGDSEIILCDRN